MGDHNRGDALLEKVFVANTGASANGMSMPIFTSACVYKASGSNRWDFSGKHSRGEKMHFCVFKLGRSCLSHACVRHRTVTYTPWARGSDELRF